MNEMMRKLLQLEAFEIRTLLIQYYEEHHRWPESFDAMIREVEYNTPDSLYQSNWVFTIAAAEGPTSYWAITIAHVSGVTRTFCVEPLSLNRAGEPISLG